MPSGKLKGKSPEERKKQWLTHFFNLLGTPDKNPPIENIPLTFKNNIIIEDGVFTLEMKALCFHYPRLGIWAKHKIIEE